MNTEDSVQMLMSRVSHLYLSRGLEIMKKENIRPGQGGLLMLLRREDGLSQKEIAGRLNVKPPSITVMLKKMENGGYIRRRQDENDQRITRIYITEEGQRAADIMEEATSQLDREVYAGIEREELLFMRRLLLQMEANLEGVLWKKENLHEHFHHQRKRGDL